MRTLSMIVALGLSATLATSVTVAEADIRFSARIGTGAGTVFVQKGKVFRGGVFKGERWRQRRPARRARHRLHAYPYYLRGDRRYRDERVITAPAPVETTPIPPVAVAPVEPPPPPDPRGPLRLTPARGVAPAAVPYTVGEALPQGLPHVTLDWRQFDLPEPPPGQLYARVGRDVLLITATGRIVEIVVPLS